MSNLIKYRWFELRHNWILRLMFLICVVFAWVLISPHYLTDSPMVPGIPNNMQGLFIASAADCIFPLLIISGAFTAMMLGRQFSDRTIDLEIAAGHSRAAIFAVQCLVAFVIPGATVLLAILIGCFRWAGIVPISGTAFLFFIRAILLLLLLSFSLVSACILFAVLFRDTAKTMAVSAFFLLIACWTMPAMEQPLIKAPGTLYPTSPSLALLLHPAFLMRYVLYPALTPGQGIWVTVIAASWSLLFLGTAYCIFRHCELK